MSKGTKRHKRQYFSVNISRLLLFIDGSGNGVLGGMLRGIFDSVWEGHVGYDERGEKSTDGHYKATTEREATSPYGVRHLAFHSVMSLVAETERRTRIYFT